MHYHYCRIHQALRVSPAMEADLCDHVWSTEELVALLDRKWRGERMQRTLREQISHLEEKIVVLKRQLRSDNIPDYQRHEQELDLANAGQALDHLRRAYEMEQKIQV